MINNPSRTRVEMDQTTDWYAAKVASSAVYPGRLVDPCANGLRLFSEASQVIDATLPKNQIVMQIYLSSAMGSRVGSILYLLRVTWLKQ